MSPSAELPTDECLDHSTIDVMDGLDGAPIHSVIVLFDRQPNKHMARNATTLILPSGDVAAFQVARVDDGKTGFALINKLKQHSSVAMCTTIDDRYLAQPYEVVSVAPLDPVGIGFFSSISSGLAGPKKLDRRSAFLAFLKHLERLVAFDKGRLVFLWRA
jgi:hypothetical protein